MSAPGTCASGKTRYPSATAADRALERVQDAPMELGRMYRPVATVRCHRCNGWHLTSKIFKPNSRTAPRGGGHKSRGRRR